MVRTDETLIEHITRRKIGFIQSYRRQSSMDLKVMEKHFGSSRSSHKIRGTNDRVLEILSTRHYYFLLISKKDTETHKCGLMEK